MRKAEKIAVYLLEVQNSTGRRHLEQLTAHPTAVCLRCQAACKLIPTVSAMTQYFSLQHLQLKL